MWTSWLGSLGRTRCQTPRGTTRAWPGRSSNARCEPGSSSRTATRPETTKRSSSPSGCISPAWGAGRVIKGAPTVSPAIRTGGPGAFGKRQALPSRCNPTTTSERLKGVPSGLGVAPPRRALAESSGTGDLAGGELDLRHLRLRGRRDATAFSGGFVSRVRGLLGVRSRATWVGGRRVATLRFRGERCLRTRGQRGFATARLGWEKGTAAREEPSALAPQTPRHSGPFPEGQPQEHGTPRQSSQSLVLREALGGAGLRRRETLDRLTWRVCVRPLYVRVGLSGTPLRASPPHH
jgi:hypothetical protein